MAGGGRGACGTRGGGGRVALRSGGPKRCTLHAVPRRAAPRGTRRATLWGGCGRAGSGAGVGGGRVVRGAGRGGAQRRGAWARERRWRASFAPSRRLPMLMLHSTPSPPPPSPARPTGRCRGRRRRRRAQWWGRQAAREAGLGWWDVAGGSCVSARDATRQEMHAHPAAHARVAAPHYCLSSHEPHWSSIAAIRAEWVAPAMQPMQRLSQRLCLFRASFRSCAMIKKK